MNKSRVLTQCTRHLRVIATIEQIERPRLARRLAAARCALAELQRRTHLNETPVNRLRREVLDQLPPVKQ